MADQHVGRASLSAYWFPIVLACGVCVKLLLGFGYRSTDFEVHRNWMAIAYHKPIGQWYTESTSQWTLDYPPLFAWFELLLAQVAALVDPEMLSLRPSAYESQTCVVFQRASVVLADIVLVAGLMLYALTWPVPGTPATFQRAETVFSDGKLAAAAVLVFLNGGLLIVDSVHFQYNGMLLGMLLIALACWRAGWFLAGAAAFTLLLLSKHLFLVLAPLFATFLLAAYVLPATPQALPFSGSQLVVPLAPARAPEAPPPQPRGTASVAASLSRLGALSATVLGLTALTAGPFLLTTGPHDGATAFTGVGGAAMQLLRRLFPFARGLTHAYWAPNWWAVYRFIDMALVRTAPLLARLSDGRISLDTSSAAASATRGVVGTGGAGGHAGASFGLLAAPSPALCAALSLLAMLPALAAVWRRPSGRLLPLATAQCALSAFLFGWHVHEKAVLTAMVPMALAAVDSLPDMAAYNRLLVPAMVSLCPLLFGIEDRGLALALAAAQVVVVAALAAHMEEATETSRAGGDAWGWGWRWAEVLHLAERAYQTACAIVAVAWAVWPLVFADGGKRGNAGEGEVWMPFLPLMMVSVVSAVGIMASWAELTFVALPRREAAAAEEADASVPKLKRD